MNPRPAKWLLIALLLIAVILLWGVVQKLNDQTQQDKTRGERAPAPVQVAKIEQGSISQLRTFSATLEAHAEFVVASKLNARLARLYVDLADPVQRGQLLAQLDDAEYLQEVARAEAELAVERASYVEAESLLGIADRELQRLERLAKQGSVSASQLDIAKADQLAKQAQLAVSTARITQAEATLAASRIRLAYTRIHADWQGDSDQRLVAERLVDEGETVDSNAALLRIVDLDPIIAAFHITEREYAQIQPGQEVSLSSDAFPGEQFHGKVTRIAPVFNELTRQARIELEVDNPQLRLKPGMFARATLQLQQIDNATIVPQQAISQRGDQYGVFVIVDGKAEWRTVSLGVLQGERQQVMGEGLQGEVVTLGQQLLDDGAPVRVVEEFSR